MTKIRWRFARVLLGLSFLAGTAGIAAADIDRITKLDDVVSIEGVQSTEDEVRGRIVNETDDQLENVRLLVSDQFLWRNERHPGPDSPSDAAAVVVPGPIPPHGSVTFRFKRPSPLPDRRDGTFVTDITPVELTRRPTTVARSYESTYQHDRTYEQRTYDH
jgi:hypothetical protein